MQVPTAVCSTCVSGLRPQPQPEHFIPWGAAGAERLPAALAMSPSPQYLWVFGIKFSGFTLPQQPLRLGSFQKGSGVGMVWGRRLFLSCVCVYLMVLSHPAGLS